MQSSVDQTKLLMVALQGELKDLLLEIELEEDKLKCSFEVKDLIDQKNHLKNKALFKYLFFHPEFKQSNWCSEEMEVKALGSKFYFNPKVKNQIKRQFK